MFAKLALVDLSNFHNNQLKPWFIRLWLSESLRAIKWQYNQNYCYLLLSLLFNLLILVYVIILNKNYLWKIFTEDEFERINYVGRYSAARLGRGFQTRPSTSDSLQNSLRKKTSLIIVTDVNMMLKRAFLQKLTMLLNSTTEKGVFTWINKLFLVFFCHNDHHG